MHRMPSQSDASTLGALQCPAQHSSSQVDRSEGRAPLLGRSPAQGTWWQRRSQSYQMRASEIQLPRGLYSAQQTCAIGGSNDQSHQQNTMMIPGRLSPPAVKALYRGYMAIRSPAYMSTPDAKIEALLNAELQELHAAYPEPAALPFGFTVPARAVAVWLLVQPRHPNAESLYDGFAHLFAAHSPTCVPLATLVRASIAVGNDAVEVARFYGIERTWQASDALLLTVWPVAYGNQERVAVRSLTSDTIRINQGSTESETRAPSARWWPDGGAASNAPSRPFSSIAELFRALLLYTAAQTLTDAGEDISAPLPVAHLRARLPPQPHRAFRRVLYSTSRAFASLMQGPPDLECPLNGFENLEVAHLDGNPVWLRMTGAWDGEYGLKAQASALSWNSAHFAHIPFEEKLRRAADADSRQESSPALLLVAKGTSKKLLSRYLFHAWHLKPPLGSQTNDPDYRAVLSDGTVEDGDETQIRPTIVTMRSVTTHLGNDVTLYATGGQPGPALTMSSIEQLRYVVQPVTPAFVEMQCIQPCHQNTFVPGGPQSFSATSPVCALRSATHQAMLALFAFATRMTTEYRAVQQEASLCSIGIGVLLPPQACLGTVAVNAANPTNTTTDHSMDVDLNVNEGSADLAHHRADALQQSLIMDEYGVNMPAGDGDADFAQRVVVGPSTNADGASNTIASAVLLGTEFGSERTTVGEACAYADSLPLGAVPSGVRHLLLAMLEMPGGANEPLNVATERLGVLARQFTSAGLANPGEIERLQRMRGILDNE